VNSEGGTFTVTSNATNANTGSTIVFRDASGNFSAGTITANLTGTASNANTLDSLDSTQFLRSDTAATITAPLTIDTNTGSMLRLSATNSTPWAIELDRDDATASKVYNGGGYWQFEHTPRVGSSIIWHAGNDGAGSGLDADTVDGYQTSLTQSSNTVAVRDGSGYLFAQYFNGNGTFSTSGSSSGMVNFTGTNGSDTYGRSYNGTAARAAMGLATTDSPSFAGLNINGNLNAVDNIYLASNIYHEGDTDTYFNFGTNTINLVTGNSTSATFNSSGIFVNDGSVAEDYDALSGTTPTCNVDNGGMFSLTMTGNTTFTFSGASSGYVQGFILQLVGNGSTVTWPASVDWAGGTAPDAPASGETDIYVFITRDGGTTWYGVLSVDAAA